MALRAWGDESESSAKADPGAYILAAAVAHQEDADELRTEMTALRLRSSGPKLHWVDESPKRRELIATTVGRLPVQSFVVVRKGPASDKPERRRKKCLEVLLQTLTGIDCPNLDLESRGPHGDARDLALLDSLRRGHRLGGSLRLSHTKGPNDPMLWLADALCGAVGDSRLGRPEYLEMIAEKVNLQMI